MIKSLSPIYDLIRADGSIVINKNLIFALGMNESIIYTELLSKFNYFFIRETIMDDGFFFNTVDNLQLDTGLGEKSQRSAIVKLKNLNLIDYKLHGVPPKRYFKIIDDTELLFSIIEEGRLKRQALEKKQLESVAKSKLRLLGGFKNSVEEEIKTPLVRVNNTKPNNTKPNDTKKVYINFPVDEHIFYRIYDVRFRRKFGKGHTQITTDTLSELRIWISRLIENGITNEIWTEGVQEHFENLPEGNNGSISVFMTDSFRYFEIQNNSQCGGY